MNERNNENKRLKSKERWQKVDFLLKDNSKGLKVPEGTNALVTETSTSKLSPLSILNKFSRPASKVSSAANAAGAFSVTSSKTIGSIVNQKLSKIPLSLPLALKENTVLTVFGDGVYKKKDTIETKFITKLMQKGKKEKAEIILVKALKKVEQELLKKANAEQGYLNNGKQSVSQPKEAFGIAEKGGHAVGHVTGQAKALNNKVTTSAALGKQKEKLANGQRQGSVLVDTSSKKMYSQASLKETDLSKILEKIVENAKPLIRLKKIRIAGATHQKPVALTKKQAETDAIKRIITNAKARSEKSATLKLAKEFEEIYFNIVSNKTLTEVRELHKLAEVNKANITLK